MVPVIIFIQIIVHVVPAMMTKFQCSGGKSVMFWGDGTQRESSLLEDLADACLFAMDHFENAG